MVRMNGESPSENTWILITLRLTMKKLNKNSTLSLIGWKNGDVPGLKVWVLLFHGTKNSLLNLFRILPSTCLSILLLIFCKVMPWMVVKLVPLESKLKTWAENAGTLYLEKDLIQKDAQSQKKTWANWDMSLNFGTQWIWECQVRIWLETILQCAFTITLLCGKTELWCQGQCSAMDTPCWMVKKCLSQQVTLLPLDKVLKNLELILQDLPWLMLVMDWMMLTLKHNRLMVPSWNSLLWKIG